MESAYLCVILHVKHKKIVFIAVLTWFPLLFIFSPPLWISMFFFLRNSSPLFSITRSSSFSVIHVSVNIKNNAEKDTTLLLFFLSKSPGGHVKTLSCIWVAIPVDWVILHWYACGADGRSLARCTVTWLPNFLGWVDYHISLAMGRRAWSSANNNCNYDNLLQSIIYNYIAQKNTLDVTLILWESSAKYRCIHVKKNI